MDYADDTALLANTPALPASKLHSLEGTAGGIGLHVKADKTKFMHFNQRGNISTINGGSLNKWTSSPTWKATSHQLKMTSIHDLRLCGQQSIDYLIK